MQKQFQNEVLLNKNLTSRKYFFKKNFVWKGGWMNLTQGMIQVRNIFSTLTVTSI